MVQTASKLYEGGKKYLNFFVNLQDYIGDVQPNRQDKQLCSEFGLNRRPALEKLKQKTVELHYENVGPSFYRGGRLICYSCLNFDHAYFNLFFESPTWKYRTKL